MDEARLIANPCLLAQCRQNVPNDINFLDKLNDLLRDYYDIYLSNKSIHTIKLKIDDEIDNILIDRIINECLESCIEKIIQENKFDFCLPFD